MEGIQKPKMKKEHIYIAATVGVLSGVGLIAGIVYGLWHHGQMKGFRLDGKRFLTQTIVNPDYDFAGNAPYRIELVIQPDTVQSIESYFVGYQAPGASGHWFLGSTNTRALRFHREAAPWNVDTPGEFYDLGKMQKIIGQYDGRNGGIFVQKKLNDPKSAVGTTLPFPGAIPKATNPIAIGAGFHEGKAVPATMMKGIVKSLKIWSTPTALDSSLVGWFEFDNIHKSFKNKVKGKSDVFVVQTI